MYMSDYNEESLISQLLAGDRWAIKTFIDTYGKFMYNVIFRILTNSADTEEATQDAVMKVIHNLASFDKNASLKAWCYTISYRTAIDYKRKVKYHLDISTAENVISSHKSDDIMALHDQNLQITKMMNVLDDESKAIVTLYYLEEKNIKEIISQTGLTESNIKIKLFRARKLMAESSINKHS